MKTILAILQKAGGWRPGLYLKIENAPYMELVIEAMDESGPCGLPSISVAHYGEQNGDLMRDPEMCFELGLAGGASSQSVLLAKRLCSHRAVEPLHPRGQLLLSPAATRTARELCEVHGTPTCDSRASRTCSRTSASSASPLTLERSQSDACRSVTSALTAQKEHFSSCRPRP